MRHPGASVNQIKKEVMAQQYANVGAVPLAIAVFLASDNYDHNDDPNTISATALMKSLRQIILPTRMVHGEALPNLADQLKSRVGSAIHDGIERAWLYNYGRAMHALGYPQNVIDKVQVNPLPEELRERSIPIYLEQRLSKKVGKWTVTGKFDFVAEGKVQDFKTTSVYTYKNQVNATKHTLQGSIYRWLDPKIIFQNYMEIHYIFMDWKANMARNDPNYPKQAILTQSFDLLELAVTNRYITQKLSDIEKYWNTNEADIPQCTDEDLWRSEPKYKYYKNGDITSKRSTKNFDSWGDAVTHMQTQDNSGAVKIVPGQVTACKYCSAFALCSQKDQLILNGELILD